MASNIEKSKKSMLRPIPWIMATGVVALGLHYLFRERVGILIVRLFPKTKSLISQLSQEEVADDFLELLLTVMDIAFCLSKSYRKHIKNFQGRYLFETSDGKVRSSATFKNGNMKVHDEAIADWDVKVTFANPQSLWKFIFSQDRSILDLMLENEVETDGNLNYIYKFLLMARDLKQRLGIV